MPSFPAPTRLRPMTIPDRGDIEYLDLRASPESIELAAQLDALGPFRYELIEAGPESPPKPPALGEEALRDFAAIFEPVEDGEREYVEAVTDSFEQDEWVAAYMHADEGDSLATDCTTDEYLDYFEDYAESLPKDITLDVLLDVSTAIDSTAAPEDHLAFDVRLPSNKSRKRKFQIYEDEAGSPRSEVKKLKSSRERLRDDVTRMNDSLDQAEESLQRLRADIAAAHEDGCGILNRLQDIFEEMQGAQDFGT